MNALEFEFSGQRLAALGSGALWWPDQKLLCVSDMHLGKSERVARRSGQILPPYEGRDTLSRLATDLELSRATTVVCLGDSFDDLEASDAFVSTDRLQLISLQAGRHWIWIEGNHDPGPVELGGTHLVEWSCGPLKFRHIAQPGEVGEVSGHYHPKARLRAKGRTVTRPAFLVDYARLILPAYGTYTGGLHCSDTALADVMAADARAILTGAQPYILPMPR
ncbi:ligase-associated DNA damage response endonuclease PdeM [Ruegeria arenilitoris]|uniref:ligase-associated DNA damage response endonuclease PdeM n=1 Tax=Ruegeria arenilitoris TaxID=1173585 RepID=UPI0014798792|nr:ligase-associated DNA damage response endonuclease PdeM [Ruegeria arenilitoris]